VTIEAGQSYTLRRTVADWHGNIANTIGRIIKDESFVDLPFPVTVGGLTIESTNAYGSGGPSPDKILPYIDFVFNPL
jgi:hypothetical protein